MYTDPWKPRECKRSKDSMCTHTYKKKKEYLANRQENGKVCKIPWSISLDSQENPEALSVNDCTALCISSVVGL